MLIVLQVFWRMSTRQSWGLFLLLLLFFYYYLFFSNERAELTPGAGSVSVSFCNVTKGWFLELEQVREVTDGVFSSRWSSLTGQIFGKYLAAAVAWYHQTPHIHNSTMIVNIHILKLLEENAKLEISCPILPLCVCGHLHSRWSERWICSLSGVQPQPIKSLEIPSWAAVASDERQCQAGCAAPSCCRSIFPQV